MYWEILGTPRVTWGALGHTGGQWEDTERILGGHWDILGGILRTLGEQKGYWDILGGHWKDTGSTGGVTEHGEEGLGDTGDTGTYWEGTRRTLGVVWRILGGYGGHGVMWVILGHTGRDTGRTLGPRGGDTEHWERGLGNTGTYWDIRGALEGDMGDTGTCWDVLGGILGALVGGR